jgi:serine/threonine protein kinase
MIRQGTLKSPKERAELRVGSTLVKWKLDELLGVGGMAAVYGATHLKNRSRVALKVLHRALATNEDVRERFLREAYVANSVGHPGAVQVLDDALSEDDEPFLIMELLDGRSLEALQIERGTLSAGEVLGFADQLLDVLAAAHDKGIVHRDIKPQNLIVTRDGRIKVLDFGVARILDGTASATVTGSLLGTPAFMPPEQASGRTALVCAASDLWSVGATMFTLLTGRFVHEAENAQAHVVQAAVAHARSLASILPAAPSSLVRIVDRALAFEIGQRWPDARAMQRAVRDAAPGAAQKVPSRRAEDSEDTADTAETADTEDDEETRAYPGKGVRDLIQAAAAGGPSGPFHTPDVPTLAPRPAAPPAPSAAPPLHDATTSVVLVEPERIAAFRASSPGAPPAPPPPAPPSVLLADTEQLSASPGTADAGLQTLPLGAYLPPEPASGLSRSPSWPGATSARNPLNTEPLVTAPMVEEAASPRSPSQPQLAPPPSPPEATSVNAQSISQVTGPPNTRRPGLGRIELGAIAGAVLAILTVTIVVLRAVVGGGDDPAPAAADGPVTSTASPSIAPSTSAEAPAAAGSAADTAPAAPADPPPPATTEPAAAPASAPASTAPKTSSQVWRKPTTNPGDPSAWKKPAKKRP